MSDDPLKTALAALPRIATEDRLPDGLLPDGFNHKYEIKSFRNAANLLTTAHGPEVSQLFDVLNGFEIQMEDILKKGGNKSQVAKKLEALLHPLGWNETRISGDLLVRKRAKALNTRTKSPKFLKIEDVSVLENFLDGHQIDFVKDRVAFDLEWNSKDQTFDRDLYAMRAFYDCGIIDVGIILADPEARAAVRASLAGFQPFEDRLNALNGARDEALKRLLRTPAPDLPALALKIELAVDEAVATLAGGGRCLAVLKADGWRLASGGTRT